MNLKDVFTRLVERRGPTSYRVHELESHPGSFLGVDSDGRPCFFLSTDEHDSRPIITTSRLVLQLSAPYDAFSADANMGIGHFHAILLTSKDASEVESFLYIVEGFVNNQPPGPINAESIIGFFDALRRLFSTDAEPDAANAQQGLWGELYVMRATRGFRFLAHHWHTDVNQTFDFSAVGKRIEVKTSTAHERIHRFAHTQIFTESEEVIIASLLLHADDAGLTLRQLIEEARNELVNTPDYYKLEKAVRKAGMGDPRATGPAFNEAGANAELKWFRASEAPRFESPEPDGVSDTHYLVDLSNIAPLSKKELDEWLDLWADTASHQP